MDDVAFLTGETHRSEEEARFFLWGRGERVCSLSYLDRGSYPTSFSRTSSFSSLVAPFLSHPFLATILLPISLLTFLIASISFVLHAIRSFSFGKPFDQMAHLRPSGLRIALYEEHVRAINKGEASDLSN